MGRVETVSYAGMGGDEIKSVGMGENGHNFCTCAGLYSRLLQDKMATCWAGTMTNNKHCGRGIVLFMFLVVYVHEPDGENFVNLMAS